MSNRADKLKLWNKNSRCHWCQRVTVLTNITNGIIPPDAATVDHLFSKFDPRRWTKEYGVRKVLSCYECNFNRSIEEHKLLSKEELTKRSRGFTLNPRKTFSTLEGVIQHWKEKGVDISEFGVKVMI